MIEVTMEELKDDLSKILDLMCEWGLKATVYGMSSAEIRETFVVSGGEMPTAHSPEQAQRALRDIRLNYDGDVGRWIEEAE